MFPGNLIVKLNVEIPQPGHKIKYYKSCETDVSETDESETDEGEIDENETEESEIDESETDKS